MTTITMQLPNELVDQAKQVGVKNEQALVDLCKQLLDKHISVLKRQEQPTTFDNRPTLTVAELANSIRIKTDKQLSREEINESFFQLSDTHYLLSSPINAEKILQSIAELESGMS